MMIIEAAKKYLSNGIAVIPAKHDKKPDVKEWGTYYKNKILPDIILFKKEHTHLALICGAVSGNVEVIDFDIKHDDTGLVMKQYTELIVHQDPDILDKVVIQQTQSGGYHFIYRCDEISGNLKLALIKDKNGKTQTLLETRGEGGYIIASPSLKYKVKRGDIYNIPRITTDERNLLINTALGFNKVSDVKEDYKEKKEKKKYTGKDPFEDYNNKINFIEYISKNGWIKQFEKNGNIFLKRDGSNNHYGANYSEELKCFYVWSQNAEPFEADKWYSPSQVYTIIEHDGDFGKAADALFKAGYGERGELIKEINIFDHIVQWNDDDKLIKSFKDGTMKMGLSTGFADLDKYFMFKEGDFVAVNGHFNIGKTFVITYLSLVSAVKHGWKWIIYSSENRTWSLRKKLMEFVIGEKITIFSERQYELAWKFVDEHFVFIRTDRLYSGIELIEVAQAIQDKNNAVRGFLVDPYNSLRLDMKGFDKLSSHEYHYEIASRFRIFANSRGVSTFLNCHAITEALRRKGDDGFISAPFAEDTEGGGKFANRADDFITLHRKIQHPDRWMDTEIHVRKIKEYETGGHPTPQAEPVILSMMKNGCGFENKLGENPFVIKTYQEEIDIWRK